VEDKDYTIYSYYCFCATIISGAKRSSKGIGMRITTQTYYFAIRVDDLKSYEDKPVELARSNSPHAPAFCKTAQAVGYFSKKFPDNMASAFFSPHRN
jgi:hypothetical protein